MLVGYARTSTTDQVAGLEAQERDLRAAGCEEVFAEQVSSIAAHRPALTQALKFVRKGDVLIVTKPCRLARSTADLLHIVDDLTARGVGVRILSMAGTELDTRSPTAKLMLTMLAAVAHVRTGTDDGTPAGGDTQGGARREIQGTRADGAAEGRSGGETAS